MTRDRRDQRDARDERDARDALRSKRARDMLALIDGQRAMTLVEGRRVHNRLARAQPDGDQLDLRLCSARELEWLDPEIKLNEKSMIRTDTATHSAYGVASPFMPSILVVIYTARYFLANRSAELTETRDVHIVYGALEAVEQPYERGMGAMELP